jgi:hypothetical protein
MRTTEIVFEILFAIVGIALVAAIIRYPKATFIDIPLGLLKRLLFFDFFVGIFEILIGKEGGDNEYKIQKKIYFDFNSCNKLLLTKETDELKVKSEIKESLSIISEKVNSINFVLTRIGDELIIQPNKDIPFYEFHFLVQSLAEAKIETVGLVESKAMTYSVYNDPNSVNLIGQTDKGDKFFITLLEGYEDKQFILLNRSIETNEEYDVENLKARLRIASQSESSIHALSQPND